MDDAYITSQQSHAQRNVSGIQRIRFKIKYKVHYIQTKHFYNLNFEN